MQHLSVFSFIGRVIERKDIVPDSDILNGFSPFGCLNHCVPNKTFICHKHLELFSGMFCNVIGNCPTATCELEERRAAYPPAPHRTALLIPFQLFPLIKFVTGDFRLAEVPLVAQVI